MNTWWLVLISRSRRDSATAGLGNSGYQSAGARLLVKMSERPVRPVISSYRSSAWAAVSSRMPKSSSMRTAGGANWPHTRIFSWPLAIEVVATTRDKTLRLGHTWRRDSRQRWQAVYLAVMKGNLTLNDVPTPAHSPLPTGHYLAIIFDRGTLQPMDMGLSEQAPPGSLQSLGPVSTLTQQNEVIWSGCPPRQARRLLLPRPPLVGWVRP
jgi:hypothetical protein